MEALERRGKIIAVAVIMYIVFLSQCKGVEAHKNSTKMSYVCPPDFIRLGHSCYFFSENKATWQSALFSCKDRDSNLSVPARWEDRNLRNYLNRPAVEKASRWIGGIYDYSTRAWKWGGELRDMHYQSFSKMKKMTPDELKWHCIAMSPEIMYRWAARNCFEPRQYICQTKLKKVPKSKLKDLRRRYSRMGKINEITAPSVSREVDDPRINDVTSNPIQNPKSYDLRPSPLQRMPKEKRNQQRNDVRPNELRKRSRPNAQRRLTRPFPGYRWNRRDPEGSYQRNAELLRSGRTGLTPQQVSSHLTRLQHIRDRQLARRKRLRDNDWLVNEPHTHTQTRTHNTHDRTHTDILNEQPAHARTYDNEQPAIVHTHARTYTVDNNISALHPKTIVEEFDMMPPPPPIVLPRPVRNIW
ncbi:uncharacterized protein LOC123692325 [Colias croceus]|uniref:uncharacterized protein LOC123692325 n=1 Tax=Colias crocea TaxID=72248 RepID=UPI001E27B2CC|nr:uncharacterized protein LOC123692325 [Colias croceus]